MLNQYYYRELLKHVNILENGAILLGENISVDGHGGRRIRVVTHAHSDHVNQLSDSVRESEIILATPVTIEMIELLGYVGRSLRTLFKMKAKALEYNQVFSTGVEKVTLLPADHIVGSAQVMVEYKGYRLGYTGDFKLTKKTAVMKNLDVLVIEATYGNPTHRRPFKDSVPGILYELVNYGLSYYGQVFIYGYHGKVQEAMKILREKGVSEPFVLTEKIYEITKALEKYGFRIANVFKEGPGRRFERSVVFKHMMSASRRRLDGSALHIVLSGWEFREPFRRVDDYTYLVALSDHSDFDDLVQYVETAKPGLVVVDASRNGDPQGLASSLREKGYCTVTLPGDQESQIEEYCL
ncbi:exonuclease [Thermosphaera chiliense]|uniref:Exonuclease n=1 Tax=Thermosphaera chiliense TaxID=3402707 RepID=A0A7M1URL2_9CREN|nr:MBL fold metallo-hydrolase [Thermosphaera aggregans]QOR94910.1 exonuclease [Thermosphaera aggregans]